jgi:ribonuclease HI
MTDPAGRPTIVADASFCPLTRAAGWSGAIIIVVPGTAPKVEMAPGGAFQAGSSNNAEMAALCNAVGWAIEAGHIAAGQAVLLATDSQHVVNKIKIAIAGAKSRKAIWRERNGLPPAPPNPRSTVLGRLAHDHSLTIEVVMVAGHPSANKRRESLRARIVAMVDQHSRRLMKSERARLWRTGTVGVEIVSEQSGAREKSNQLRGDRPAPSSGRDLQRDPGEGHFD